MASPFEDIFDRSAPDWAQLTGRLEALADEYRVPRDLVRAVVTQESNWDINAVGDGGRARGWFQLHPGAATDAGIDPTLRHDPWLNMLGGVRYLRLKLDQAGGDVDKALRLYNGGGDPNYVANVRRHLPQQRQQPGVLTRAASILSPARAEAATPTQGPPPSMWEDIFGPQTPTTAPAPSTQPGGSQGAETRFLALPSIQQLPEAERQQRLAEFRGLQPDLQAEFLASEEPPSQLTVDIEKSSPTTPGVPRDPEARAAQIRAERADWERQQGRPWREGDPLMPTQRAAMAGATSEAPLEEGWTKPSTLIPLLMGIGIPGRTIGAPGAAVAESLVGKAGPLITRGARAIGEGISQTLGWGTGRTLETGQVPTPGEVGTEAVLNVAAGGILEGLGAAGQRFLRRSKAGQAIAQADEATTAARQEWETAQAELRQTGAAKQTERYQTAERRVSAAQAQYQRKLQARDELIATNQQTYDEAVRAAQEERYATARQTALEEQRAAAVRQQQYQQGVTGQQQALQQAQAIPGRYTPDTPSWVLYEKFGDAAKDATVDLAPAKAALAEVRASRGVLPDGTVRPFPAQVESIAANLEKATGETSLTTIREELRRLGPLTRSQDGNVRGAAKQLYGVYADVLEASPVANDLLRQANATFRKEMALQDVSEWLRPGHGIVRIDQQGRQTINVGALMTRLEKQIGDDALFRRSFTPDELTALRQDVGRLAGTPSMPRGGPPAAAAPVQLPGAMADLPSSLQQPPQAPAMPAAPRPELLPGGAGGSSIAPRPTPAPEAVTPRQTLGARPRLLGPRAGEWGAVLATLGSLGVTTTPLALAGLAKVTAAQSRWLLANAMLSDRGRQLLKAGLTPGGTLPPRMYGALVAALSPEEKRAYQRETRDTRR